MRYSALEHSAIMRSLGKILVDEKFSGSPQMSAFLHHVVTETLIGNGDRIKAYTVAVDALGKSESFDPQTDPSVRVLAKRLRTCLDEYHSLANDLEIIIEIKPGSYRPIFSEPQSPAALPSSEQHTDIAVSAHGLHKQTPAHTTIEKPDYVTEAPMPNGEPSNVASSSSLGLQASTISEAGYSVQQPAGVTQYSDSIDKKHYAQLEMASAKSLGSKLLHGALVPKLLSGALLLVVIVNLTWVLNDPGTTSGNTEITRMHTEDIIELQLASATSNKPMRQRPNIPTVIVRTNSKDDTYSSSLLSSISHVISKFDHLLLLRSAYEYEIAEKWPEDYEISVDTLVMNDSKKVTIRLIHAESGRITYSDEIILNDDNLHESGVTRLSKNNIAAVELAVARIVQKNGPLVTDYRKQAQYSETMACIFSNTAGLSKNNTNESCLSKIITDGQSHNITHTLLTEIRLKELAKTSGSKRDNALKAALTEAKKGLDLAPYSADAHTSMMQVSRLKGDYATALKHGNHAININAHDSINILAFSVLLDEMKRPERASEMRKQASALSNSIPNK